MAHRDSKLKSVFNEALERAPQDRAAYLDEACAGDPELRQRVDALLGALEQAGVFLESPALAPDQEEDPAAPLPHPTEPADSAGDPLDQVDTDPTTRGALPGTVSVHQLPLSERAGQSIGPYKLLQQIGEGGMGAVFMAEQERPVRRRVALKVIKPGMDSAQVIARFEAERQALALMDHPNIAKVLDAGTTVSGRPYFVMELVRGVPITRYCDETRLDPKARLELFIPVCHAIQHAHQKGIIHRDIKPSNVMVTLIDGTPVPKVIDFGVAKATDQRLTERTMFTQFGALVGTPEYMSPEQAELSGLDVDTRSDIYSLGVLLYELLTGTTPLDRESLRQAAFAEILKRIKEEDPPKPSTRLSASGDRLASLSAMRHTEPAKLTKQIRGDLDWIVMKALEKDRTRRYETATGFARDLKRYLDHDPVEAGPPSAAYKLSRYARKHRAALLTASGFAALLVLTSVVSTWQAIRAARAERAARLAEATALEQRNEATAAKDRAEVLKGQAEANFQKAREAVDEYFTKVSESKLLNVPGLQPLRKELLESARKYYQGFLRDHAGDPSVRAETAEAWYRLGYVLIDLNPGKEAITAFERAVGMYDTLATEHPEVERYRYKLAMSLNDLGNEQAGQGMETEARRTQQRCLALRQQIARDHPDVAEYQKELGIGYLVWADREEISGAIDRSLESARHGREVFERLARAYPDVADYSYRLTGALQRIARSFHQLGRTEESEAVLRQATELAERVYHDHPEVLDHKDSVVNCYRNLGWVQYRLQNRLEDALATYQKAKAIEARTVLENPDLRVNRTALARLHHEIGRILTRLKRFDEALAEYEPALRTYESDVARDPSSFRPRRNLAYLYFDQGRVHRGAGREREAAAAWRRALPMFEEVANSQAVDPYDRACVQAICAAIVGNAADPLPPADQARRERFAEAAVAALREAVRGGYHSVPMVESDPDFDAIREREDFKALMAELRVGGPSLNAAATEPASPDAPTRAAPDSKAGDG